MKSKKLTKLMALWLCHELWHWLWKNPDKYKTNYYKKILYIHHCPCCEYSRLNRYNNSKDCSICPLLETWSRGNLDPYCRNGFDAPCENYSKSPYHLWEWELDKKKNAKIISDSAYKEYKRIGGRKEKLR